MNPSYLMVRRSLEDAMARYGAWVGSPELAPPLEVAEDKAIDLALEDGQWKGLAVYIFVSGPWTVFEELSGGLADRPVEEWARLADGGDLMYAGYNDAIGYGEFIRVDRGRLVRQFLEDEQEPSADVNVGKLPEENVEPMMRWTDVAKWVEEEEEASRRGSAVGFGSTEPPNAHATDKPIRRRALCGRHAHDGISCGNTERKKASNRRCLLTEYQMSRLQRRVRCRCSHFAPIRPQRAPVSRSSPAASQRCS